MTDQLESLLNDPRVTTEGVVLRDRYGWKLEEGDDIAISIPNQKGGSTIEIGRVINVFAFKDDMADAIGVFLILTGSNSGATGFARANSFLNLSKAKETVEFLFSDLSNAAML